MMLAPGDLDADAIRAAPIFWATGTGLSDEPSRAATLAALEMRDPAAHDDPRPRLAADALARPGRRAPRRYAAALAGVTVVVGNRDEVEVAVGELEPHEAAAGAARARHALAIVKLGGEGVLVATADGRRGRRRRSGSEVVNGLGAGDAFGGALCHRLLAGDDPAERRAVRQRRRRARRRPAGLRRRDADRGRGARAPGGAMTVDRAPTCTPGRIDRGATAIPLVLTPERARLAVTAGLRVVRLAPGERRELDDSAATSWRSSRSRAAAPPRSRGGGSRSRARRRCSTA